MTQFYIRVSKNDRTTGEHASDDAKKAGEVFDELKATAPEGSLIVLRDFGRSDSLVDQYVVPAKQVS